MLRKPMESKSRSERRPAEFAGVADTAVKDLCGEKAKLEGRNADTFAQYAKVLPIDAEESGRSDGKNRCSFSLFRSNVCHCVKRLGDIDFLLQALRDDEIRKYYCQKQYPECFYLLAMVDYLSRKNGIPLCDDYDDLRKLRLTKRLYPAGVEALTLSQGSDEAKELAWRSAIPEFKRFNIVENEVYNVV